MSAVSRDGPGPRARTAGRGNSWRLLLVLHGLHAVRTAALRRDQPARRSSSPATLRRPRPAAPSASAHRATTDENGAAADRRQGDLLDGRPRLVLAGTGPAVQGHAREPRAASRPRRRHPLPTLYAIGAGQHPSETPPYDQLSFRFQGGFPSYDVEFVPELIADGSGLPVPMPGTGAILKVVFRGAQAHTADGTASTITARPPRPSATRPSPATPRPATSRACSATGSASAVRCGRCRRPRCACTRSRRSSRASTCTSWRSSWTPPPGSSRK